MQPFNTQSGTTEDAVPQLSVPLPCDGLLTPESICYTIGRFQKPLEDVVNTIISRVENLEEAIEGLHHDIHTLMDNVAMLKEMERSVTSQDDIALVQEDALK
jgi:hypothetical protein